MRTNSVTLSFVDSAVTMPGEAPAAPETMKCLII
jgi:hypothetical protein